MLFKELAGIDAWPICVSTQDSDEIVRIVQGIAPSFGGINLEDISAPRCFEIERHLKDSLDIPVMHDDQHGTAVVILAALRNALKVVKKRIEDVQIVVNGLGAAGLTCCQILLAAGASTYLDAIAKGLSCPGTRRVSVNPDMTLPHASGMKDRPAPSAMRWQAPMSLSACRWPMC